MAEYSVNREMTRLSSPPPQPSSPTHLLVNVGVDSLLALQPLGSDPAQLLLGALVSLQQGAVCILAARVVRRGPQPVERGLSTEEKGPKGLGQQPEDCSHGPPPPNVTRGTPLHATPVAVRQH